MAYQTPYTTSSPYGPAIPTTNAPQPQLPPNFNMMAAGQMPGFAMNGAGMPQQPAMIQRMHPHQQNPVAMGVSTPQRPFNGPQGTPGASVPPQQPQFSTPQMSHGTPQSHTPSNAPQPNAAASTPQTPTFPLNAQGPVTNGASNVSTPLSPSSESREKEAFSILLDINQELLCESIYLQNAQHELKKEQQATAKAEEGAPGEQARKPMEEEKLLQQDYIL